jgi:OMF family outer membrane factor
MDFTYFKTMKYIFILCFITTLSSSWGQSLVFHSWEELSKFIQTQSVIEKVGQKQLDLAELTEKAAVANIFNPRVPMTGSAINNTDLPVNFIPGEAFGGPVGSFREITLGQQYITSFTVAPQFDIINVSKWQEVKTAKANTDLVVAEIALNKKKLLEQANLLYCNALMYQKQEKIALRFVQMADSLLTILENKNRQGLVRIQEVNDAQVNLIQQNNILRNVQSALATQLRNLSGICQKEVDIETNNVAMALEDKAISMGDAELKKMMLQYQYAVLNQRSAFYDQLPVLAFQSSLAYQNNSNQKWADPNQRWIYSSFVGMKITWDFPTNAVKYTNVRSKKINTEILALQLEEEKRNTIVRNQQASADYQKALEDYQAATQILGLERSSYFHSKALFEKDLMPLDKFLQVQKKFLNTEMDFANAQVNILFQKNKIAINNAD